MIEEYAKGVRFEQLVSKVKNHQCSKCNETEDCHWFNRPTSKYSYEYQLNIEDEHDHLYVERTDAAPDTICGDVDTSLVRKMKEILKETNGWLET